MSVFTVAFHLWQDITELIANVCRPRTIYFQFIFSCAYKMRCLKNMLFLSVTTRWRHKVLSVESMSLVWTSWKVMNGRSSTYYCCCGLKFHKSYYRDDAKLAYCFNSLKRKHAHAIWIMTILKPYILTRSEYVYSWKYCTEENAYIAYL